MTRRLLTILAADVANYSGHVEVDEETTLAVLSALRQIMDPIIATHSGQIANTAGDSVLAWFGSPVEALRAAIEFQQAHKTYNDAVQPAVRLAFRVGINIGDVVIQPGGDIMGHGVNVAARLEALAEPGGICLSQNVMDQVDGKVEFAFSKVGEHRVKNVAKPITVYSVGEFGTLTSRLRRRLARAIRNPALPLSIAVGVACIVTGTLWYIVAREQNGDKPEIADLVENSSSADEILSAFDLVTTGNFEGHTYHVIRIWGGEWAEIERLAGALGGYVASIGSQAENEFIFELSLRDEGHWVVYGTVYEGPMIGLVQQDGATEPGGGWVWQNGEPVSYINWSRYAPDNWRGNQKFANYSDPNISTPARTWGDSPSIHASVVIEVPWVK